MKDIDTGGKNLRGKEQPTGFSQPLADMAERIDQAARDAGRTLTIIPPSGGASKAERIITTATQKRPPKS